MADQADETRFDELRRQMVERQLLPRGIRNQRVLAAMGSVRRHLFLPDGFRDYSYDDGPQPIGEGQTISQPYMVAAMTEALGVKEGDRVLEVGTGSGYQAAVLSAMGVIVHSIERNRALGEKARMKLKALNVLNVTVHIGDGTLGLPEEAPFKGIIVTAGGPVVPESLKMQLDPDGGVLVIPVGGSLTQELLKITRKGEEFTREDLFACRFVPLIGEEGWK